MQTRYRCTKCGAEDLDRGLTNTAPDALTCWKCKAGMGMNLSQMFGKGAGMFPYEHYDPGTGDVIPLQGVTIATTMLNNVTDEQ